MKDGVYQVEITTNGTYYSEVFDFSNINSTIGIIETLEVVAIDGSGVIINVTPEFSIDGAVWFSCSTVFTQKTATGNEVVTNNEIGSFRRYKIVVESSSINSISINLKNLLR